MVAGIFVVISVCMVVVLISALTGRGQAAPLDDYGPLPAFAMTDHTGARITDVELRGHVVVANFVYTRCQTVCPVFSMKMHRIQDRTGDLADALKLISFSVDPEHDTPAVLAAYADKHGADPARWRFVSGDSAETVRALVTDGFKLALARDGLQPDGSPNIVHAQHFVLIDGAGRIRGYYDSNDATRVENMLRDARRLVRSQ